MYVFRATIHARAAEIKSGDTIELNAQQVECLEVPPAALATTMPVSFEQAEAQLATLGRMFVEPDGSFVWVSSSTEQSWQVDGVLYDRGGQLIHVDMKGSCTAEAFDQMLAAFGWPSQSLMFQLAQQAVFVGEDEFRMLAQIS